MKDYDPGTITLDLSALAVAAVVLGILIVIQRGGV